MIRNRDFKEDILKAICIDFVWEPRNLKSTATENQRISNTATPHLITYADIGTLWEYGIQSNSTQAVMS